MADVVRVRVVPKAPHGTGWDRFCPPQTDLGSGLPEGRYGKSSRLFTAGWKWNGKVDIHLVDGMEQEYTMFWRDGTGNDR